MNKMGAGGLLIKTFADIPRDVWEGILSRNGWNEVDLRDTRYNHIIHMVSAANGAEPFYSTDVSS